MDKSYSVTGEEQIAKHACMHTLDGMDRQANLKNCRPATAILCFTAKSIYNSSGNPFNIQRVAALTHRVE